MNPMGHCQPPSPDCNTGHLEDLTAMDLPVHLGTAVWTMWTVWVMAVSRV